MQQKITFASESAIFMSDGNADLYLIIVHFSVMSASESEAEPKSPRLIKDKVTPSS